MARRAKVWTYVGARVGKTPPSDEKSVITAACERAITDVLTPRFLPVVRPQTEHNYPVFIHGKWNGNKYRFMTRYKCAGANRTVEAFDAPFARLDYASRDCFDLQWHRHTGAWHRVGQDLSLEAALHQLTTSEYFMPC